VKNRPQLAASSFCFALDSTYRLGLRQFRRNEVEQFDVIQAGLFPMSAAVGAPQPAMQLPPHLTAKPGNLRFVPQRGSH
jgi:hypothetical protein